MIEVFKRSILFLGREFFGTTPSSVCAKEQFIYVANDEFPSLITLLAQSGNCSGGQVGIQIRVFLQQSLASPVVQVTPPIRMGD